MKVLVGCEFSGRVSKEFRDLGHEVLSCDIISSDIEGPHYTGDLRDLLDQEWDLVIAFPPCTYLCAASNSFKNTLANFQALRAQALEFFLTIYNSKTKRVACENPHCGYLSSAFRKPDQIIQPYQFNQPFIKPTGLWLKNLPPLKPTGIAKRPYLKYNPHSAERKVEGRCLKSITYEGIAQAMASQWSIL